MNNTGEVTEVGTLILVLHISPFYAHLSVLPFAHLASF